MIDAAHASEDNITNQTTLKLGSIDQTLERCRKKFAENMRRTGTAEPIIAYVLSKLQTGWVDESQQLVVPGRIVMIEPGSRANTSQSFRCYESAPRTFRQFHISATMVTNHAPSSYEKALASLQEKPGE